MSRFKGFYSFLIGVERSWLWIGLTAFLIGTFICVSSEVYEAGLGQPELIGKIDDSSIQVMSEYRSPSVTRIAVDVTALGSGTVLSIIVLLGSLYLIFQRKFIQALLIIASAFGSGVISVLIKSIFERTRPGPAFHLVDVDGFSYPSGHSFSAAAVYFTLAIIAAKDLSTVKYKVTLLVIFFILIMAASRSWWKLARG